MHVMKQLCKYFYAQINFSLNSVFPRNSLEYTHVCIYQQREVHETIGKSGLTQSSAGMGNEDKHGFVDVCVVTDGADGRF